MDAMRLTSTATRAGALPVTCPTKSTEKGHRSCLARGRTAALHPLRRLPRSDQHVPATAANGLITRRRRPTTSRLSRCPSPRRAPRGANASSGCPAIGEAVELTTEELATARGLLRRLTIAARAKATTRARDQTQRGYRSGGDRRIGPPPRTQPAQPAASRYQPGSPPPRATASARQDLPRSVQLPAVAPRCVGLRKRRVQPSSVGPSPQHRPARPPCDHHPRRGHMGTTRYSVTPAECSFLTTNGTMDKPHRPRSEIIPGVQLVREACDDEQSSACLVDGAGMFHLRSAGRVVADLAGQHLLEDQA